MFGLMRSYLVRIFRAVSAARKARTEAEKTAEPSVPNLRRVAVLGHMEAGKTTFLAMVFHRLENDPEIRISPRDCDSALGLKALLNGLFGISESFDPMTRRPVTQKVEPRFPAPTNEETVYTFSVALGNAEPFPLQMSDYDGQTLSLVRGGSLSSTQMMGFWETADCVLFFIDPLTLDDQALVFDRIYSLKMMCERLMGKSETRRIPMAMVVSKSDTLEGFHHEEQAALLPRPMAGLTFEQLRALALRSEVMHLEPSWPREVEKILDKTAILIRTALCYAETFQVFFISSVMHPEKDQAGILVPPQEIHSLGLKKLIRWCVQATGIRRTTRRAFQFLKGAALLSFALAGLGAAWYFPHFFAYRSAHFQLRERQDFEAAKKAYLHWWTLPHLRIRRLFDNVKEQKTDTIQALLDSQGCTKDLNSCADFKRRCKIPSNPENPPGNFSSVKSEGELRARFKTFENVQKDYQARLEKLEQLLGNLKVSSPSRDIQAAQGSAIDLVKCFPDEIDVSWIEPLDDQKRLYATAFAELPPEAFTIDPLALGKAALTFKGKYRPNSSALSFAFDLARWFERNAVTQLGNQCHCPPPRPECLQMANELKGYVSDEELSPRLNEITNRCTPPPGGPGNGAGNPDGQNPPGQNSANQNQPAIAPPTLVTPPAGQTPQATSQPTNPPPPPQLTPQEILRDKLQQASAVRINFIRMDVPAPPNNGPDMIYYRIGSSAPPRATDFFFNNRKSICLNKSQILYLYYAFAAEQTGGSIVAQSYRNWRWDDIRRLFEDQEGRPADSEQGLLAETDEFSIKVNGTEVFFQLKALKDECPP